MFCVSGFADYTSVKIGNGISPDNYNILKLLSNTFCLCQSKLFVKRSIWQLHWLVLRSLPNARPIVQRIMLPDECFGLRPIGDPVGSEASESMRPVDLV